jgi:translation initiation factor IF-1
VPGDDYIPGGGIVTIPTIAPRVPGQGVVNWEKRERGGILAKDDLANLEGTVTEARGGGNFVVRLENGHTLTAKLGGAMRRFRIRVISGDRVTIGVSPYDPTHGLILYRHKN